MEPFDIQLNSVATQTVIAFGGLYHGLMITPFEFFNILRNIPINKIFVRDLSSCWYCKGVSTQLNNPEKLAKHLKDILPEHNRLVTVGSSAGGFGAMIIGEMLDADVSISFSPQTSLDKETRLKYGDDRFNKYIDRIQNEISDTKKLRLLNLLSFKKTAHHIYYCEEQRLDVLHANALSHKKNVYLHPIGCNIHAVARWLRDNDMLKNILYNHITGAN